MAYVTSPRSKCRRWAKQHCSIEIRSEHRSARGLPLAGAKSLTAAQTFKNSRSFILNKYTLELHRQFVLGCRVAWRTQTPTRCRQWLGEERIVALLQSNEGGTVIQKKNS